MESEGAFDVRGTHPGSVPRPAGPPNLPGAPPVPGHAPTARPSVADWLRMPRPAAAPGIWRLGHRDRPEEEPDQVPGRQLLSGALIAFLAGWLLWSLLTHDYLEGWWIFIDNWWMLPLQWVLPDSWRNRDNPEGVELFAAFAYLYIGLLLSLISVGMGRVGNWSEVWKRYGVPLWPLFVLVQSDWRDKPKTTELLQWASGVYYVLFALAIVAVVARVGTWPVLQRRRGGPEQAPPPPETDPGEWPELRSAGLSDTAHQLTEATRGGALGDVDYARIRRAWQGVQARPDLLASFAETVRRHGAAACAHPSGLRDLPVRTAVHDLASGQVRIGTAADDPRNPYPRRTTGLALDPSLLGTSLVAVGPSGAGKSVRLVRPVVESMCLLALANRAAVVMVAGQGGGGPTGDGAFDLVIPVGRPGATHDLDLYGGADDPDEAARMIAEALVGDLAATLPGGDSGRAATALAQLIGPYRHVHGRFPAVPELRELLGGAPAATAGLRAALEGKGGPSAAAQLRELDARERQSARADDVGVLLAERIAFLDRPAFADSFRTDGSGRQFSLRAIEHPLRVRIDLPERGHAEASRIVARLVLAQFTEAVLGRADRSLFAALILDDATHTVTADSVRAIQRLRSANAGVLLALRTLEDVPEQLRGPLLGAVGCRMAFAGLAPWDGNRFAEAWGTEWVQTRDVTNRQIVSDEPLTKAMHLMRRLVTGRAVTAEAVTVREVERARWSASDLAHQVPAGHAVLSLTTVRGEHTPPLLVDLRT
ncbi:hypothetical protein GCM10010232_09770 [Streptomyces amakusaensis]|uniref:ATP/GTP-binding protein n=1 Tax=Streptomyces amakusaensis TaxID=67271 RepID=A0ABW0ASA8_9ACTN